MKKIFKTIILILAISINLKAQNINIPDPNFKAALLADTAINKDSDKANISLQEAQNAKGAILVNNKNITSLKGIEEFPNIVYLSFSNNKVSEIDLSNNLKLESLICESNLLTSLNLENNIKIWQIYCSYNQISTIDVSGLTYLRNLNCTNNKLTLIKVGNMFEGLTLSCKGNPDLKTICIPNTGGYPQFYNADWFTQYKSDCYTSNPQNVNIPDRQFKEYLLRNYVINTDNDKANISFTEAAKYSGIFSIGGSEFTTLKGIEAFTMLTELSANVSKIDSLDLSQNKALVKLFWSNNNLTSIDLSNNTLLENVSIVNGNTKNVNLTNLTNLKYLTLSNNKIETIDLNDNINLIHVNLNNNNLSNLNLDKNQNLKILNCNYNPYLGKICISPLSIIDSGWKKDSTAIFTTNCDTTYISPNSPIYIPDPNFKAALLEDTAINKDSDKENISYQEAQNAKGAISVSNKNITSLIGIEAFKNIIFLNFSNNLVSNVDLSNNTELGSIYCESNNLSNLNLENNTKLWQLYCKDNKFTTLDLRNNDSLILADCRNNILTLIQMGDSYQHIYLMCIGNPNLFTICIPPTGLYPGYYYADWFTNYKSDCYNSQPQNVIIPDRKFKELLLRYNDNTGNPVINIDNDKANISFAEAANFTGDFNLGGPDYSSLKGIEAFTNLNALSFISTSIKKIDLSKNKKLTVLNSQNNTLDSLDLSSNTNLEVIQISNLNLSYLNYDTISTLRLLNLSNNKISELDLKKFKNLKYFNCSSNNLSKLDLSKNDSLISALCIQNKNLYSICIPSKSIVNSFWAKDTTAQWSINCTSNNGDYPTTPHLLSINNSIKDTVTNYNRGRNTISTCVTSFPDSNVIDSYYSFKSNNDSIAFNVMVDNQNWETSLELFDSENNFISCIQNNISQSNNRIYNLTNLIEGNTYILRLEIGYSTPLGHTRVKAQNNTFLIGINSTITSIENQNCSNSKILLGCYNIQGQNVESNYKGFIIRKYSDGSIQKTIQE